MRSINCVLADLVNQKRIAEEYGLCKPTLLEKLKCASSYYWLYNNAWSCLDDCQQNDISVFITSNFNCTSYIPCTDKEVDCTQITAVDTISYGTDWGTNIIIIDDYYK